jgi:hypothetical protein
MRVRLFDCAEMRTEHSAIMDRSRTDRLQIMNFRDSVDLVYDAYRAIEDCSASVRGLNQSTHLHFDLLGL